jgi:hypothetical protein
MLAVTVFAATTGFAAESAAASSFALQADEARRTQRPVVLSRAKDLLVLLRC